MYEHTLPMQLVSEKPFIQSILGKASGLLAKEYEYWHTLLAMQPEAQKHILKLQAHKLADALSQGMAEATITFPESLVLPISGNGQKETKSMPLAEANQRYLIKKHSGWFTRETLLQATQKRLASLEASPNLATAAYGGLLRFAVAHSLIYDCLPAGQEVTYSTTPDEDIPSIPNAREPITIGAGSPKATLASRFYLPQWVAFDEKGQLLVDSIDEAEAFVVLMQHYLEVLYEAVALAPYMVVDQMYQKKFYGISGQLVNQCRGLCWYRTNEIITTIRRRSTSNNLNRGLRITMPYFDDQSLVLRKIEFEIIPSGRVMFTPAFLIMAVQQQMTFINHDTTLNFSTRKHLLDQLKMVEKAFDTITV